MMIDRIRDDRLVAMKARNELEKNLLGTLFAAAAKDSKTPDDTAVLKTIRSFLKALEETVTLLEVRGLDSAPQRAEQAILARYLPQAIGDAELRASIAEIVSALPERSPKSMGQVMAVLKARYGDCLDNKAASGLVRAALG